LIKKKFAIFGGSFDPPHLGHQKIVEEALELKEVDKVLVIPTYLNPFKSGFHLLPQKRLELVERLFEDNENVIVEDFEIKQNRAVWTVETVKALKKRYNITSIIIGADNLKSINRWREFEWLNSNLEWIVLTRDKEPLQNLKLLKKHKLIELDIPISSTKIRAGEGFDFVDKKILDEVKRFYKGD